MYNPFYEKLHKKLLRAAFLLGFSPIIYEKKCEKYKISTLGQARAIWQLIYLIFYQFLIIPTHTWSIYQTKDYQMLIFTTIVWLTSLMGVVVLGNFVWNTDEILQLWNGYHKYLKYIDGKALKITKYNYFHQSCHIL